MDFEDMGCADRDGRSGDGVRGGVKDEMICSAWFSSSSLSSVLLMSAYVVFLGGSNSMLRTVLSAPTVLDLALELGDVSWSYAYCTVSENMDLVLFIILSRSEIIKFMVELRVPCRSKLKSPAAATATLA